MKYELTFYKRGKQEKTLVESKKVIDEKDMVINAMAKN